VEQLDEDQADQPSNMLGCVTAIVALVAMWAFIGVILYYATHR
jgi:hypothetical protein